MNCASVQQTFLTPLSVALLVKKADRPASLSDVTEAPLDNDAENKKVLLSEKTSLARPLSFLRLLFLFRIRCRRSASLRRSLECEIRPPSLPPSLTIRLLSFVPYPIWRTPKHLRPLSQLRTKTVSVSQCTLN